MNDPARAWKARPPPGEQVQGRVLAEHTRLLTGASEADIRQELRGLYHPVDPSRAAVGL